MGSAALLLLTGASMWSASPANAASRCEEVGCARVIDVTGLIDPVVVRFIDRSLDAAERTPGTVALVLEVDSSGVVVPDARFEALVRRLTTSSVPVSAWIGTGSEATRGAAELVAALDETSMAPGSRIGDAGAQRLSADEFGELFAGDAAGLRDRAVSAGRARDLGVIDRVAPSVGDHLLDLPGVRSRVVTKDGEQRREPRTQVTLEKLPLTEQLFHTAASPAVAYLMMAIGIGLLVFEFFTAGVGVAGAVGALALLGGGYGVAALPHRTWAVALLVAAGVAFGIDVQAGVPRFWTAVGLVGWVVGSTFLFQSSVGHPWIALTVGIVGMAIAMLSGMPAMVRARFGTPTIGREWMVGEMGSAVTAVDPDGIIEVAGGQWRGRTNRATPIAEGEPLRVVAIDGLTLEVEPEEGGAVDHREMRKRSRS